MRTVQGERQKQEQIPSRTLLEARGPARLRTLERRPRPVFQAKR